MNKVKELKNKIAKLQEELNSAKNEEVFESPEVKLPTAIENAIAWYCIATGHDVYVCGEDNYIAYSLNNDEFFAGVVVQDENVETDVYNYGCEYSEFYLETNITKFCCRFSPIKKDTYSITFLKVEIDKIGTIVVTDIQ